MSSESRAYHQLALQLREAILSGQLAPGEKLKSELSLADEHGLSRTTVRLAVKELEQESLVYRRRGSGTYVAARPNPAAVTHSTFSSFVRGLGKRVTREVLDLRQERASAELASELELDVGEELLWFHRLDRLDGQPLAFDYGWILAEHTTSIDRNALAVVQFYEHWQQTEKLEIVKSVLEIAAEPADSQAAELLQIQPTAPILLESTTVYTADHGAGKFVTHYRHDMYRFKRTFYGPLKSASRSDG